MKSYTPSTPPEKGTALKIWNGLSAIPGIEITELHYNPNNWGQSACDGWGTWACHILLNGVYEEMWCGWKNGAYLMKSSAPFSVIFADDLVEHVKKAKP